MNNYPDDIRQYDHDPRSPFYEEPVGYCESCGHVLEEGVCCNEYCEWCGI